ncbi:MAG: PorV/PorQ family protein [Elusimicrobia bacterium]|nr:PorV/PorQ family protein [Elusimicrobiota bacterium]
MIKRDTRYQMPDDRCRTADIRCRMPDTGYRIIGAVISLFFILGLVPVNVHAKSAGTTALESLNIGLGARPVGMGEAYAGLADDANAVYWNPAGIGQMKRTETTTMYNKWFEGVKQGYLSFVHPLNAGTLGGSLSYLSYGEIKGYDLEGVETGELYPKDAAVALSFAKLAVSRETSMLYGGANLKIINQNLDAASATAIAVDLGGLYRIEPYSLGFGLVIQNLGMGPRFVSEREPLPLNLKFGISARFLSSNLITALDVNVPRGYDPYLNAGAEYNILNLIYLRAGWQSRNDLDRGLRVGGGIGNNGMSFDYAYVPYGEFRDTHRFSLTVRFGKKYGYSVVENDIEDNFNKAKTYYDNGKYIKAYMILEGIMSVAPRYKKAQEYLAKTQAKIEEADVARQVETHMSRGKKDFSRGNIIKAQREFETVLSIDPENQMANEYIKKIKTRFEEVVTSIYNQGMEHFTNGEYEDALEQMNKVLSLDPGNTQAQDTLLLIKSKMQKIEDIRKKQMAEMHYKKGQLLFNQGQYDQALEAFQLAMESDPSNSKISRAIREVNDAVREKEREKMAAQADGVFEEAMALYNGKSYEEAIRKFRRVLDLAPGHPKAQKYLNEASETLAGINRQKAEEYNKQGLLMYSQGNLAEAKRLWELAVKLSPDFEEAQANLSRVMKEKIE